MMHWIYQLVCLAIDIYIAYWVYTDAQKRGMNGVLWGILSFLTCPIATVIYFIMRKPAQS